MPRDKKKASSLTVAAKTAAKAATPKNTSRVSPKVRKAIDLMIHHGKKRDEAALAVGLRDASLRTSLTKIGPLAYLHEQQNVLRTSAKARTLHRVEELMDQDEAKGVALEAAKTLMGMDKSDNSGGTNVTVNVITPGYVIDTSEPTGATARTIEHEPTDDTSDAHAG